MHHAPAALQRKCLVPFAGVLRVALLERRHQHGYAWQPWVLQHMFVLGYAASRCDECCTAVGGDGGGGGAAAAAACSPTD